MESQPILITLDRPRQVRWTERAQARNSSLRRPVSFSHLSRGRNRLYALCAHLWAALVDREHDFDEPEDLAQYLTTEDQQLAALDAVMAMLREAFPEKKSPPVTSADASATTPPSGPEPSLSSAHPAPGGKTSSPGNPPRSKKPGTPR